MPPIFRPKSLISTDTDHSLGEYLQVNPEKSASNSKQIMTAPVVLNQSASPASPEKPAAPAGGTFAIDPSFGQTNNIKVAIRLRPFHDQESAPVGSQKRKTVDKRGWNLQRGGGADSLVQKGTARKKDGHTAFHFDHIFDEDTKTPLLYMSIARPMVKTVLSGRHGTIFAYGQTGSGKTFTMQGDGKAASGQAGIIQLVASDLFRFMKQGALAKRDYVTKVSYVEIYNEKIRDLLSDETCGSTASHGTPNTQNNKNGEELQEVTIRTTGTGEIVLDCVQTEVTTVDNVLDLLISGNANRVVAATDMNRHSSRSHAIFRLTVESKDRKGLSPEAENEVIRISDFNLVDLAGSESVKMANTSGVRLREGAKINQSLLSLSTVIHSLSLPEKKRPRHINYRDSKLTRILKPHLSGNAEMAVLCCASPSKAFVEETRSTLKFAARAKLIQMKPKVNEVHDDSALIKKLRDELAAAHKALENMKREQALSGDVRPPTRKISDARSISDNSLGYGDGDPSGEDLGYGDTEDLGYGDASPCPTREDLGYGDATPSPIKDDLGYGDTGQSQESLGYGDVPNATPSPIKDDLGYGDTGQSHESLGYGDVPKQHSSPTKNRQYVMPKPQQHSGPLVDDLLPKNRQYVMPKDHPDPGVDDLLPKNRQYIMPKDRAGPLQSDLLPKNRQYGMPKNQAIPTDSSMKSFLKPPQNDDPEESPFENSANFQLDAVSDEMAQKTVSRYMAGQIDTDSDDGPLVISDDDSSQDGAAKVNSLEFPIATKNNPKVRDFPFAKEPHSLDFPMADKHMGKGSAGKGNNMTATTEDESFDGPEGSYAAISFQFGSGVSAPDTLLADSTQDQGSRYGTIESAGGHALDGRAAASWDTLDMKSVRPEKPQDTMRHLSSRAMPIPQEITIITPSPVSGKPDLCLTDQLEDAEQRARFFDEKLEMSDDLIEALFKDLERARLCIHGLVYRNVNLAAKVQEKRRKNTQEEHQEGEVILEQYWLLKGAMYASLFFFFTGGYELFLASVILIWLILEANTNTAGKTEMDVN